VIRPGEAAAIVRLAHEIPRSYRVQNAGGGSSAGDTRLPNLFA
jgi:hypothetical protein